MGRGALVKIFSLFLVATLGACSPEPFYALDAYTILEKSTDFTGTRNRVSGTGTLLFDTAFDAIVSSRSFELTFQLQDGGSLRLYSHGDDTLTSAVEVLFTRAGTSLQGTLVNGATEVGFTSSLTSIDASTRMEFFVNVANTESTSRIVVWTYNSRDVSKAALDTDNSSDAASPGPGLGTRWGLALTQATLSYARNKASRI